MEVGCATLLANDVRRGRIELLAALPLDVCLLFEALLTTLTPSIVLCHTLRLLCLTLSFLLMRATFIIQI